MIPHVNDTKNGVDDEYYKYAKEPPKRVKWYKQVLQNGPLKVALALILTGILTPILVYQFVFFTHSGTGGFSVGSCLIQRGSRLPCGLENLNESQCHQQCCYDPANKICFHRFPSRFSYIMDQQWAEEVVLRPRVSTVPFKSQISTTNLRLSLDEVSKSHLTITYYNSAERSLSGNRIDTKDYEVQISSAELNVVVNSWNRTIYNTVRGPLVASENIWEIALKLTDETMYGFGEIPIEEGTVKIIYNHKDGTNSIPLIFAKVNSSYHGLLIDTVNPTEVSFRGDNLIVIRSLTNFGLRFHLFTGPKPVDVMKDVRRLIGFKDLQYWMLGAHMCSEYKDVPKSTSNLNNFVQGASTDNLPFESHCVMPVIFDDMCESETALIVNEGATILRNAGKKFIPHVSPYVHYTEINDGTEIARSNATCNSTVQEFKNSMLQNFESSGLYKGSVDDRDVVYPNYDNVTEGLLEKLWVFGDIDGVVLENSWPLDESEKCVNGIHNYLPYFSQHFEKAFNHTPQWNATNNDGKKYLYSHNQYGNHFANAFDKLKPSNSMPTWLSSHWMNGNVYVSRQHVNTTWMNLQKELTEAALGGISGQWYWSTPVCGDTDHFNTETHRSLCIKWYMAAIYFPMIRIHSKGNPRDPLSFQGTDKSRIINALRTRMSLAPYFFSTLHVGGGGPLLRPMFYQFPESESLKDLSGQFSVGDDLVVVPNLLPNQAMVHMWLPPGVWYEMWSGLRLEGKEGDAVTMSTVEDDIFTAIRGGAIIALQKDVKLTADLTRAQSNVSLIVALNCDDESYNREFNNTQCFAEGFLYIDENATIHFSANDTQLILTSEGDLNSICQVIETTIAKQSLQISEITIYGLKDEKNNYDHMRRVTTSMNLCELNNREILFDYTVQ